MGLTKISEKIILNKLKNIESGNLKLVNYDGKVFHFGNLESKLSADIKITNPNFYFNNENVSLQKDLHLLQGRKRTWFCGSYFGYGFHEDGLKSSIELIKRFNKQ